MVLCPRDSESSKTLSGIEQSIFHEEADRKRPTKNRDPVYYSSEASKTHREITRHRAALEKFRTQAERPQGTTTL